MQEWWAERALQAIKNQQYAWWKVFWNPWIVPWAEWIQKEKIQMLTWRWFFASHADWELVSHPSTQICIDSVRDQLKRFSLADWSIIEVPMSHDNSIEYTDDYSLQWEDIPYGVFQNGYESHEHLWARFDEIRSTDNYNNKWDFFKNLGSNFPNLLPENTKFFETIDGANAHINRFLSENTWKTLYVKSPYGASWVGTWIIRNQEDLDTFRQEAHDFVDIPKIFDGDWKVSEAAVFNKETQTWENWEKIQPWFIVQEQIQMYDPIEYSANFWIDESWAYLVCDTINKTDGTCHEGNEKIEIPSEAKQQLDPLIKSIFTWEWMPEYRWPIGLDFMYDKATRKVKILEANPRFTWAIAPEFLVSRIQSTVDWLLDLNWETKYIKFNDQRELSDIKKRYWEKWIQLVPQAGAFEDTNWYLQSFILIKPWT